jgi:hypothetical protein
MSFVIEARRSFDKRLKRIASWTKRRQGLKSFDVSHDKRSDSISLDNIEVPKGQRKKGAGSRAMKMLGKVGDKYKKTTYLSVADKNPETGTTSRGRLEKFYRRHGYVKNKGRNKDYHLSLYANMYRKPKKKESFTIVSNFREKVDLEKRDKRIQQIQAFATRHTRQSQELLQKAQTHKKAREFKKVRTAFRQHLPHADRASHGWNAVEYWRHKKAKSSDVTVKDAKAHRDYARKEKQQLRKDPSMWKKRYVSKLKGMRMWAGGGRAIRSMVKKKESFTIVSNFSEKVDPEDRKLRLHKVKKYGDRQAGAAKLAYGASKKVGGRWKGSYNKPGSGQSLSYRGDIHRAQSLRAREIVKKWQKRKHHRGPENRSTKLLSMSTKMAKAAEKRAHRSGDDYTAHRGYPDRAASAVAAGAHKKKAAKYRYVADVVKSQYRHFRKKQGDQVKQRKEFNRSMKGESFTIVSNFSEKVDPEERNLRLHKLRKYAKRHTAHQKSLDPKYQAAIHRMHHHAGQSSQHGQGTPDKAHYRGQASHYGLKAAKVKTMQNVHKHRASTARAIVQKFTKVTGDQ